METQVSMSLQEVCTPVKCYVLGDVLPIKVLVPVEGSINST